MTSGRVQVLAAAVLGDVTSWAMPCSSFAEGEYPAEAKVVPPDRLLAPDAGPDAAHHDRDEMTLKLTPDQIELETQRQSKLTMRSDDIRLENAAASILVASSSIELVNAAATVRMSPATVNVNNGALEVT